jgi:hypothetical protein
VISRVEKEQASQAKLSNAGFKNYTLQQPTKTSAVDAAYTTDEYNTEVVTFNSKGKGKGKGRGKQEPVHEPQPFISGNQKKNKKKINFSKLLTTPCWECHQMGHWYQNYLVKAKMMAQFMKQNCMVGAMPIYPMETRPSNSQWLGHAGKGWT